MWWILHPVAAVCADATVGPPNDPQRLLANEGEEIGI